jgi:hypothetical protein
MKDITVNDGVNMLCGVGIGAVLVVAQMAQLSLMQMVQPLVGTTMANCIVQMHLPLKVRVFEGTSSFKSCTETISILNLAVATI